MELYHMEMQILVLGILILSAYLGGLLARRLGIGEVIGQILGGVVAGPHFLQLFRGPVESSRAAFLMPVKHFYENHFSVYSEIFEGYHYFVFLFLGIIAFSLGEELHVDRLKKVGAKATLICLFQAILTWGLLSGGFYFFTDLSLLSSFIVGSIGIATAPALIFILMNKLKIEGSLKNILANIVVLDDIIEVIFFSIFLGISVAIERAGHVSASSLALGVGSELLFAFLLGAFIFIVLKLSIRKRLPESNGVAFDSFLSTVLSEHPTPSVEILLIITGVIALGVSISIALHLPFLITAVTAGFFISNFHSHAIFDSLKIGNVMPIFNLIFFAVIGATVRLESFSLSMLSYVLLYVVLRSAGKLFGNWAGCRFTGQDPKITASLPKLMLPQAGMAAVETILVATLLKNREGEMIFNTIIPALVIFELGGAWLSEKTLMRWKNWTTGEREASADADNSPTSFSLYELVGDRVCRFSADTKDEAVAQLAEFAKEKGFCDEPSTVIDPVLEREKLASTAIGRGVALPHFRSSLVTRTVALCGVLEKPVEWNAPDGRGVEILFLIMTPEAYPEQHLEAIRTISRTLHKGTLRRDIENISHLLSGI